MLACARETLLDSMTFAFKYQQIPATAYSLLTPYFLLLVNSREIQSYRIGIKYHIQPVNERDLTQLDCFGTRASGGIGGEAKVPILQVTHLVNCILVGSHFQIQKHGVDPSDFTEVFSFLRLSCWQIR